MADPASASCDESTQAIRRQNHRCLENSRAGPGSADRPTKWGGPTFTNRYHIDPHSLPTLSPGAVIQETHPNYLLSRSDSVWRHKQHRLVGSDNIQAEEQMYVIQAQNVKGGTFAKSESQRRFYVCLPWKYPMHWSSGWLPPSASRTRPWLASLVRLVYHNTLQ